VPIPAQRDLAEARRALTGWLAAQHPHSDPWVSDVDAPAFTGFSNETLLFDAAWTEDGTRVERGLVARVKPTGYSVFFEPDFEVQYRAMDLLAGSGVPVPPLVGYEADAGVLGAPFFVMEKVEGRIPTDNPPYHMGGWVTEVSPDERAAMWWSGLEQMAGIHTLDWRTLGFGFLDRPALGRTGVEQQLAYYDAYFAWAAAGQANPTVEAGMAWLRGHVPAAEPVQLCWGDARIGNMIFDGGRCVAVLDWEMATLGNPVQDLAWWLFLDRHHSEGLGAPRLDGFPDVADTVRRWESLTGLAAKPEELWFYEVFAAVRFSVIMQRLSSMLIDYELVPADSDMPINNTPSQMLAKMLGLPAPGQAA
jgi:aminoglycoside phosphotransferase (APT) family kinase protein